MSGDFRQRMHDIKDVMIPWFQNDDVVEDMAALKRVSLTLNQVTPQVTALKEYIRQLENSRNSLVLLTRRSGSHFYSDYQCDHDFIDAPRGVEALMRRSVAKLLADQSKFQKARMKEHQQIITRLTFNFLFLLRLCGFTATVTTKQVISCIIQEQLAIMINPITRKFERKF